MLFPAQTRTFVIGSEVLVVWSERECGRLRAAEQGLGLRAPGAIGQLVGCGSPAGDEAEGVLGAAAGFGGEDRQS